MEENEGFSSSIQCLIIPICMRFPEISKTYDYLTNKQVGLCIKCVEFIWQKTTLTTEYWLLATVERSLHEKDSHTLFSVENVESKNAFNNKRLLQYNWNAILPVVVINFIEKSDKILLLYVMTASWQIPVATRKTCMLKITHLNKNCLHQLQIMAILIMTVKFCQISGKQSIWGCDGGIHYTVNTCNMKEVEQYWVEQTNVGFLKLSW